MRDALIKLIRFVFGWYPALCAQFCPDGVERKALGEVADVDKGVQFNKKNMFESGSYPVINGGVSPSGYIEQYNQDEETITVSQGGASAGYVNWQLVKFWAGAHCYVVKPKDSILNRFLFYCVKNEERTLQESQYGAGIPALAKSTLNDLLLPVPPLEFQRAIVEQLDAFDALCNDLCAGLPAEIDARRKEYEYYRDKLLTFKPRDEEE